MFDQSEYLKNYAGDASTGSTLLPANTTVRLPDIPCRFVMLAVMTVTDGQVAADGSLVSEGGAAVDAYTAGYGAATTLPGDASDASEVYYGFGPGGAFGGQIFPGESTQMFPVNNLNQVRAKSAPDVANVVYWTVFN